MVKKSETETMQEQPIIDETLEYTKYIALRQNIDMNLQLADNKVNTYILSGHYCKEAVNYFLEALTPNLNTPEPPEGYLIFNATELEHIKYQCEVCRNILLVKHAFIKEGLEAQRLYEIEQRETKARYNKQRDAHLSGLD